MRLWWLAINGSSCAAWGFPCEKPPKVTPRPEILIGFRTEKEQLERQKFLLTAPVADIAAFFKQAIELSGDITLVRFSNPEPQTDGMTIWEGS